MAATVQPRFDEVFSYTVGTAESELFRPRLEPRTVAGAFAVGSLQVQPVDVLHGADTILGYVFSHGGRRIAYLTDCKSLPPATVEAVRGADVLVLSALWNEPWEHSAHLSLDEAMALADTLACGRVLFTHMTHSIGLHAETEPQLPPSRALAYDGLVVRV
jgi:phosphoribosyl 1,2-cyclic phosphate phosphodiesterase